tara:strand:- start:759 stop:2702 length:1944 start_codon:yes stop_codon:yes gene_type:complete
MAVNFLNNIDLNNNQLLNARVHVNGSAPAGAGKGSIWLNSTTNELNFHNGTNFVSVLDDTTIANTQNVFATSFVDSSNDVLLRLTKSGASSGTQDIKFVAGSNVTLTPSGVNMTIASANTQNSAATTIGMFSGSGVISLAANGTISSSAEANVDTDLGKATHASQITITSSTGDNVVIGEATASIAGLMSTTHHDKLDGITASADVNRTAAETRTLIGTGNSNLVPAAPSSPTTKFLRGDGSFQTPAYIANTTTGAQMTEGTLRSKLGSITENVTIGDATDVQVTIAGNLVVSGTTTTVNSTTVNLNDHNIVLDSGNSTSGVVNGAGITLEGGSGSDATFTYRANTAVKAFELKLGEAFESLKVDNLEAASLTVTEYNLATGDIPSLAASKITSGEFGSARIPNLNASKITAGSFATARIPSISTDKLTSGTLPVGRGGTGLTSVSTLLNSNTTKSDVGLGNVANETRATILGGNLTGQINSVAVATVTSGAAAGATANQDSTSTIRSGTTAANVGLGNVTNESKATMFSAAALTGNSTALTQSAGNNSTRIATTAFVTTATALIGKITKKLSGSSATTYTITHGFGTPHVMVQLLDYGNNGSSATYDVVYADVKRSSDNAVSVVFGSAPGTSQDYLVLITKMPAIS